MDKVLELKTQLNSYIFDILKEDSFSEQFKELLIEEFKNTLLIKKEELFQDDNYRIVRNSVKIYLHKTFKSQSFQNELSNFISNSLKSIEGSNRTLESLLSPSMVNGLKVYIYNQKDDIITALKKFPSSENIDKKMQQEINKVLSNLNPLASRFVNPSNIIARLKVAINEFLDNPQNIMELVNMINTQLDGIMKKKLSEIASSFPTESRSSLINSISKEVMTNILSEKFIDMIIFKLESLLDSMLALMENDAEKKLGSFDRMLGNFIDILYYKALSSYKAKELISFLSNEIVDNLLNKPIISFIEP